MNGNIRVGNLFGIPFYVNPSWFLVLGLVTLSYGGGLAAQFPGLATGVPWLLGLSAALLMFASVLAHELGHSFVALSQGVGVNSITLFLFGGLASLEKESKTPAEAFWVAIAGPLVSFLLFGLFSLIGATTGITGPIGAILGLLAYINLALATFNLIPGLPLDGGNILKAAIWKITGNPYKGVRFASRVGQIFGWVAIASGLLPLFLYGNFGNFWNLLIGWFLLQNAGRAAQFATVQEQLTGLTAADAVTPNSPVISDSLSLREFADQRILSSDRWNKFLVTNAEGHLVGEMNVDALKTIPSDRWSETQVRDLVQPIDSSKTVSSQQPLLDVVKLLEEKQLNALTVIRDNGVLVGLLEKTSIIRLLQNQTQAIPA
ncbi:site-2 protease family protein [Kovacikia minuta CCNUW1]|uniref:site-2 protease family protein n=1 Tax=Kovacikia minuta TaxID=2931930 RepID=UPI001CCEA888|nr:site-2 protease family protein [Kovacikia minuta]UBF27518.1 site-2 protease family protein [Kovacikia minuta CCNUW1]